MLTTEIDVLVKFQDGHVGRPWIVAWIDRRSRYLVGYTIVFGTPNANHIMEAFSYAVAEYGIPEAVLIDNGKDYTVHDLFNRHFPFSVSNEMGVKVTNALPYNAKAKLIERFWCYRRSIIDPKRR